MPERKNLPPVRPKQIWINNMAPRKIVIVTVAPPYAFAKNVETGRRSRIRLDQFNPNAQKGFTLVEDASQEDVPQDESCDCDGFHTGACRMKEASHANA